MGKNPRILPVLPPRYARSHFVPCCHSDPDPEHREGGMGENPRIWPVLPPRYARSHFVPCCHSDPDPEHREGEWGRIPAFVFVAASLRLSSRFQVWTFRTCPDS